MEAASPLHPQVAPQIADIDAVFTQQRTLSRQQQIGYDERVQHLKALKEALVQNQDALADAIDKDFGCRSHSESKMTDLMGSVMDIRHTVRHLKRWMKPSRRLPELLFATNSAQVRYQAKGVVGIIVPWNFPLYLAVGPMTAALAAGNRVMVKMSEFVPHTTQAFKTVMAETFPADLVSVFDGDVDVAQHFSSVPFDHLVFTGSTQVGRQVMLSAAQNLTPVTLELGGKSPAVVSRLGNLKTAASKIAHGKAFNAGQVCVAPDYALVAKDQVSDFIQALKDKFAAMYPQTDGNPHYTAIISPRQFERLQAVLADAKAKGATIHSCGPISERSRQMPLQIVTGVTNDMRILQEELFGPILPIVSYDTIDDAIRYINDRDRPLALYYFGSDSNEREQVLESTISGGVTVNDWCWHVMNVDMPFGGVGASGIGHYHGREGFLELSHARSVFKMHKLFPVSLFHPPYGTWVQQLAVNLFLGKAKK